MDLERLLPGLLSNLVRTAKVFWALSRTAATAGGVEAFRIGSGTAGVLGIYAGSGVPTVSAPQGSLYLRTDGSSTSTRLYVNTNGTTGWAAITTAS